MLFKRGCEYCKEAKTKEEIKANHYRKYKPILYTEYEAVGLDELDGTTILHYEQDDGEYYPEFEIKVNYCPICGRKLK